MQVCYFLTFIFKTLAECTEDEKHEFWYFESQRRIIALFFGDDFLYSYPEVLRENFGVERFREFIWDFLHVKLKVFQTYGTLITYLPVCEGKVCRDMRLPIGEDHVSIVGHRGPMFLKKYIIPWNNFCLEEYNIDHAPKYTVWRPLIQYFQKAGVAPGPDGVMSEATPAHQISRLTGLLYDNMGVDPFAHKFLTWQWYHCWAWFKEKYPDERQRHRIVRWLEGLSDKYMIKNGLLGTPSMSCPSRESLLRLHSVNIKEHMRPYKTSTWQEKAAHEEQASFV